MLRLLVRTSVRHFYTATGLIGNRGVRVFHANVVSHGKNFGQPRFVDAGVAARFFDGCENVFGTNVADEVVAGKGAAAKASERAVEAAAARIIRRENFGLGVFGPAVEMCAEFDARNGLRGFFKNFTNDFWSSVACGIGERNSFEADVLRSEEHTPELQSHSFI